METNKVGFIMEVCKNGDLENFLRRFQKTNGTGYQMSKKLRMLREIASAYLHSLNVTENEEKLVLLILDFPKFLLILT